MAVIAMTREMGSRGRDVALGLADRLGLEVIHHELVETGLAKRMNLPESLVHRYLEGQASLWDRWNIDPARLSHHTNVEILEFALRGNVLIRGWGAAQLLRHIGNVLVVRVCAPIESRENEVMQRIGSTDRNLVRREIERNDAAHAKVIKHFFGSDWREPEHYDIVLNTERLPIDVCVDQIAQLAASPAFQQTESSKTALADKLIEVRIRNRIEQAIGDKAPVISISVDTGKVALGGRAKDDMVIRQIENLVREITGANPTTNKIERMPRPLNGA